MKRTFMAIMMSMLLIFLCGCEGVTITYPDVGNILETTTIKQFEYEETSGTETYVEPETFVEEEPTTKEEEVFTEAPTELITEKTTEPIVETEPVTEATTTQIVETTEEVQSDTGLEPPPMPEVDTSYDIYYVEPGDWLNHIAYMYGMDVDELATFNNMDVDEPIYPGEALKIPSGYTIQEYVSVPVEDDGTGSSDGLVQYGADTKTSWSAGANSFTNMEIASDVLTNDVAYIPPGGDFSWLRDVGPCTGPPYVESAGYSGGEVVTVYGGGICMTASALKVAAWKSGCVITETHAHSMPVPYNDRSRDDWRDYESTIDASGLDLKFYNPSQTTGLTIRVYTDRDNHTCTAELIPDN